MDDSRNNSVSLLIAELKRGDEDAARDLWRRYYADLVRVASKRLGAAANRYVDGEDVATDAFASMCRRAAEGQFPNLNDRDDLWRLLLRIVECKCINQRKHISKRKNQAIGDADLTRAGQREGIDGFANAGPTPDEAVAFQEELGALLSALDDESHVRICLAKLEGQTNKETATLIGCSLSSIERKLRMIRGHLSEKLLQQTGQYRAHDANDG